MSNTSNTTTHMTPFGPVEVRVDPKLDPWNFRVIVDATRDEDHGDIGGIVRTIPHDVRPFMPPAPDREELRTLVAEAIHDRLGLNPTIDTRELADAVLEALRGRGEL